MKVLVAIFSFALLGTGVINGGANRAISQRKSIAKYGRTTNVVRTYPVKTSIRKIDSVKALVKGRANDSLEEATIMTTETPISNGGATFVLGATLVFENDGIEKDRNYNSLYSIEIHKVPATFEDGSKATALFKDNSMNESLKKATIMVPEEKTPSKLEDSRSDSIEEGNIMAADEANTNTRKLKKKSKKKLKKCTISIQTATYGKNCNKKVASTNQVARLKKACDKKTSCTYRVDHTIIGNPCPGVKKRYDYSYKCCNVVHTGFVRSEASGKRFTLKCDSSPAMKPVKPTVPRAPVAPRTPATPAVPIAPAAPATPAVPRAPATPTAPATPPLH
jgi:hypothetical protein